MNVSGASEKPPASITNLQNATYATDYINWTWTDPRGAFSHVMIYINGVFQTNVSRGIRFYNATGLNYDTEYTIGTHTVDNQGNINFTWKNNTARTAPDTVSPATKINLTGELINGWWSRVQAELTATDDLSGVAKTEYSFDGINWIDYISPFSITGQGLIPVYYRSTDRAGNDEIIKIKDIYVDTVPPQIIISEVVDEGYYNRDVTPVIEVIEPNIVSRSTTLNDLLYNGNTISGEGRYTLNVTAVDIVDNTTVKIINFTVDKTPPLSITNLSNATFDQSYIRWIWVDPEDSDLSYIIVYIDGIIQANISKGTGFYNATGLSPDTQYTISTQSVDYAGNINQTWVNRTARTAPIIPPVLCSYPCTWTINYIIY